MRALLRLLGGGRRRRSLALAVRLFECSGEPEIARTVLTLSAANLFERYLAGAMSLPGGVGPGGVGAAPSQAAATPQAPGPERIVPFARPTPPAPPPAPSTTPSKTSTTPSNPGEGP